MTFEALLLPDTEKEALCRGLLAEFGVTNIRASAKGELVHGCVLPWGNHKDQVRNPTASLNYKRLTYKCLGCGSGGGLLWFIQAARGITASDHKEAKRWLEREVGLDQSVMDLTKLLTYLDSLYDRKQKERNPLPHYNERVLEPWLMIHPYLTEIRGLDEGVLKTMKVGYDPDRQRIIIPHFMGKTLVGWQARRLNSNDPDTMKYKNSPDVPRDYSLYHYDYLAPHAVVVESPMTVLKHYLQDHYESTFGAAVTESQMKLLSKHPMVILWFDNDPAGWNATRQVGEYLQRFTSVWVVDNPWAQDGAEMTHEDAKWLVTEAIPWSLWNPPTQLRCYIHQDQLWEECACLKK